MSWTEDKKTCVLPVTLKPNWSYQLYLNSRQFTNFTSEAGVALGFSYVFSGPFVRSSYRAEEALAESARPRA